MQGRLPQRLGAGLGLGLDELGPRNLLGALGPDAELVRFRGLAVEPSPQLAVALVEVGLRLIGEPGGVGPKPIDLRDRPLELRVSSGPLPLGRSLSLAPHHLRLGDLEVEQLLGRLRHQGVGAGGQLLGFGPGVILDGISLSGQLGRFGIAPLTDGLDLDRQLINASLHPFFGRSRFGAERVGRRRAPGARRM